MDESKGDFQEKEESDELYEHYNYIADPGQEKLRIDKTDKNPNLNFNGYKRAEAWRNVFSNIPFDAIDLIKSGLDPLYSVGILYVPTHTPPTGKNIYRKYLKFDKCIF